MNQADPSTIERIGAALKSLVNDEGFTFDEIAKSSGVSAGTIHAFVHGNISKPHINTINKLQKYLQSRLSEEDIDYIKKEVGFSPYVWLTGIMPQMAKSKTEEINHTYVSPGTQRPAPGDDNIVIRNEIWSEVNQETIVLNVVLGNADDQSLIIPRFFFYDYPAYIEERKNGSEFFGELYYRFRTPSFLACAMTTLAFCDFNLASELQEMRPVHMIELMVQFLRQYPLLLILDSSDFEPTDEYIDIFWTHLFVQNSAKSRIIWVSKSESKNFQKHYNVKTINLANRTAPRDSTPDTE